MPLQHSVQNTVEILQQTLQPFDEIEEVAQQLGIPYEAPSGVNNGVQKSGAVFDSGFMTLDPRSREFQDILGKLSRAFTFLRSHTEIMESDRYIQWLDKLQIRATSLIGKAMRDLIEKAAKQCRDIMQQKLFHPTSNGTNSGSQTNRAGNNDNGSKVLLFEDQPLESSFIYQKFRGLSFRMKELASVLLRGTLSEFQQSSLEGGANSSDSNYAWNKANNGSHKQQGHNHGYKFHDSAVVTDVKRAYIMIRIELLVPFIKEAWSASYVANHLNQAASNSSNHVTLSSGLRHAFSTLLRVTQLEYQLFDSLFNIDHQSNHSESGGDHARPPLLSRSTSNSNIGSTNLSEQLSQDMLRIIENISNCTRDILRPYIIRESSVDELCRVISALTEDMRSQIAVLSIPTILSKQLLSGLDSTINDSKERLTYCAETKLRQDVEMFEPLPSQLSYPDILERYEESKRTQRGKGSSPGGSEQIVEVYQTWYPPMKQTLSLLSKLYGVIEMTIFEDFARRCIDLCIKSLQHASDGVRRTRQTIHGDLFLVRHLLILREQLIPFEIKMHSVERHLDFSTTTQAWSKMLHTARNHTAITGVGHSNTSFGGVNSLSYLTTLLRFDQNNLLFQFARQGVPTMQEFHVDGKKDLDIYLKKACIAFKQSSLKMILGPLDSLLAKASAFVGEIPIDGTSIKSLSQDSDDQQPVQMLASSSGSQVVLPNDIKIMLKAQAFLRPERIKECLEQVQQLLLQRLPDVKNMLKVGIPYLTLNRCITLPSPAIC